MKKPCSCTHEKPITEEKDELINIPNTDTPEPEPKPELEKEVVKVKKVRKPNAWIIKCQEVQARPENAGLSYREVLKKAKLEYVKQ